MRSKTNDTQTRQTLQKMKLQLVNPFSSQAIIIDLNMQKNLRSIKTIKLPSHLATITIRQHF